MTEAEALRILAYVNAWFEEHSGPMPLSTFYACIVQGKEDVGEGS